ncbi:sulfotransferase domain-containing protein [Candidatus Woesearchaeota archaeon]|nr:sulfotransferase domain-containing protein [Candidatus Woesearchaeota archaeon]
MSDGFLVVSGAPRSGVSLCMDVHKELFSDAVLGEKYSLKKQREIMIKPIEKIEGESNSRYQVRKYTTEKERALKKLKGNEEIKEYNTKNSDFYWNNALTNKGLNYSFKFKKLFNDALGGKKTICKLSNQGLFKSDPTNIGKVIYMVRHPKGVAKSLELARRYSPDLLALGKEEPLFASDLYIQQTMAAVSFFLRNPEIPVLFVYYEDLLENPKKVLDEISNFTEWGDYSKAYDFINPKLNKSKYESVKDDVWSEAELIYLELKQASKIINEGGKRINANIHLNNILRYLDNPKLDYNRAKQKWFCYRSKMMVNQTICKSCLNNIEVRNRLKKHASLIDKQNPESWKNEPCVYECGMNIDLDSHLDIEESITYNFWKDEDDDVASQSDLVEETVEVIKHE